jgi:sulfoxide reductase catalytic subunit YedY
VRPRPEAKAVIFYSFGEGEEGGQYYDSQTMTNMLHPQTLLACEMNYRPLTGAYGAPLRLRVENQLGFKMVKWISAIEFAENYRHVSKGMGGYQEDHVFFDTMADI